MSLPDRDGPGVPLDDYMKMKTIPSKLSGELRTGRWSGGAVKIAFAGKGGSGKTTLSSLFARHLAARGLPVVAVDADINQHLAEALGADREPPAMGAHLTEIKEHLRGSNPLISSAAAMVKT